MTVNSIKDVSKDIAKQTKSAIEQTQQKIESQKSTSRRNNEMPADDPDTTDPDSKPAG
jgi:hypothetical protein